MLRSTLVSDMLEALYTALYVERTPFQWITLTPHGVVKGRISKDFWDFVKKN